jgi:hypothetical protein
MFFGVSPTKDPCYRVSPQTTGGIAMKHLATASAIVASLAVGYAAAWAQQKIIIEPVVKTRITAAAQPLEFPPSPEVTAYTADIPAGTKVPFHKHPYQRLVYLLEGGEISQALERIPFRWAKPSLRAERSNPVASNVPFVLDCFVGDASSQ